MLDFKYFSSVPYSKITKAESLNTSTKDSKQIRKKIDKTDLRYHIKQFQKVTRGISIETGHGRLQTAVTPFFRPRSPVETLAASIQISRFSSILNSLDYEAIANKNELRATTAINKHLELISDLTNPYTPFKDSFLIVKKTGMHGIQKTTPVQKKISNDYVIKKIRQKLEKLNIKDIKDKKWLIRKKNSILKDFYERLNKSNGLKVINNLDAFVNFKYFIGKGNNSKLIKQLISGRQGWVKTRSHEAANFVWTEWIESSVIQSLPLNPSQVHSPESISPTRYYQYKQNNAKKYLVDTTSLGFTKITGSSAYTQLSQTEIQVSAIKIYNKIHGNHYISNKKELLFNYTDYCKENNDNVFNYMPVTFHIVTNADEEFLDLENHYKNISNKSNNLWIIKPGENSNRGNGISICSTLDQIKAEVGKSKHTCIIQKYLETPFLIHKRKFDIRCYALVTCFNGVVQGYYYNEGYLRTSSKVFSLNILGSKYIHLTNDAVQKKCEDYGRYENGNKMSYSEFQKYLETFHSSLNKDFINDIAPEMKKIVADTIKSVGKKFKAESRDYTFEIFGYDFLLDIDLKPWLLEVNTNPCLELSSSHLARIIPTMLQNAFLITLDSIYQHLEPKPDLGVAIENKFELVYHLY